MRNCFQCRTLLRLAWYGLNHIQDNKLALKSSLPFGHQIETLLYGEISVYFTATQLIRGNFV